MNNHHEDDMHKAFYQWCCYNPGIEKYIFAIEHGGLRDKRTATRLKAKGVKKGMADFFFMWPNKEFSMLWIEFKHGKNKQTKEQLLFADKVRSAGGQLVCCYSVEDAIREVLEYIEEDFE